MKNASRTRGLRTGAIAAVATGALVWTGVAAAYWTDSGTATSGTVSAGTVAPVALGSCLDPSGGSLEFGEDPTLRWTAPAGVPVDHYEIALTLTSNGGTTMAAGDWVTGTGSPGYVTGGLVNGATTTTNAPATQLKVSWGIKVSPPAPLSPSRTFAGTVGVTAVGPGGWRSTVKTASWTIRYDAVAGGAVTCTI